MLNEQFEHQIAANTMENENVANTVEMAASSSKLLEVAWKVDRSGNPKNNLNGKEVDMHQTGF